ncbi:MAG: DUF2911 domain-containing protein [Bacteroidetes bacterium]|nr:DUF2911 domain-containing protein [Bacteroidota bacterium]
MNTEQYSITHQLKGLALALGILVSVGSVSDSQAQELVFPQLSSEQSVTQGLGLSKVHLKYARPSVRGRVIFGGLIPYGEVWRTGANAATSLTFDHDVMVQGKPLKAGTYALFTIPDAKEWTIIFNNTTEQWGSYKYNPADDILRFTVKVQSLPAHQETFTISFEEVETFTANLRISWEKTAVSFPITIDQQAEFEASLLQAMNAAEGKKPYFRAAMYYYNAGKDKKRALEWINQAEKESPELYHIKYWKSTMLLENNDKAGAKATALAGLKLAEDAKATEYIRNFNTLLAKLK